MKWEWSDWQQRFAWLPKRLMLRESRLVSQEGVTFGWRGDARPKWIWLRQYWQRSRVELFVTAQGKLVYDHDYALDLFDIVRKP